MDQLMAKPTKSTRKTVANLMATSEPMGFETHDSIRFLDPLPAEVKRASAANFSAYLARQSRARTLARKKAKQKSTLGKAGRRRPSSGI